MRGDVNCDPTALTQTEAAKVHVASGERNLRFCLSGSAKCDPVALAPREEESVAAERKKKNLQNCEIGLFSKCDLSVLTAPELAETSRAALERQGKSK